MNEQMKEYWFCIIGPTKREDTPDGADYPMRQGVKAVFCDLAGYEAEVLYSGWGITEKDKDRILRATLSHIS